SGQPVAGNGPAASVPHGSEPNQVWTNIIGKAIGRPARSLVSTAASTQTQIDAQRTAPAQLKPVQRPLSPAPRTHALRLASELGLATNPASSAGWGDAERPAIG